MVFNKKLTYRILSTSLLAILLLYFLPLFGGCAAGELSTLRSFSKPYAGEYRCIEATLGKKDLLKQYRSVDLVLKEDGTFELTAIEKRGKTRKAGGEYSYDEENELLIFTAKFFGKNRTKTVFMQDGTFVIEHKILGKNLVLKFRLGG